MMNTDGAVYNPEKSLQDENNNINNNLQSSPLIKANIQIQAEEINIGPKHIALIDIPENVVIPAEYIDKVPQLYDKYGSFLHSPTIQTNNLIAKRLIIERQVTSLIHVRPKELTIVDNFPETNSHQPIICNIELRNPLFIERQETHNKLTLALAMSTLCRVTISGVKGVGKSLFVSRFAYQHKNDYQIIWHVDAKTGLENNFIQLAQAINSKIELAEKNQKQIKGLEQIPTNGLEPAQVRGNLKKFLASTLLNWFIILDGIVDETQVQDYLVSSSANARSHILITSCNLIETAPIVLSNFKREESLNFIFKVLDKTKRNETNVNFANQLAERLNDLPSALAQACASIKEAGVMRVEDYLQLLDEEEKAISDSDLPTGWASTIAQRGGFGGFAAQIPSGNVLKKTIVEYTEQPPLVPTMTPGHI